MKPKLYPPILLLTLFFACNGPQKHQVANSNRLNQKAHDKIIHLITLKANKKYIDSLLLDTNNIIVLVKVPNNKNLQVVKNGKFPDEVETTYNLLKNSKGEIIYIMESPTSESGDWDIEYESYFDQHGKLFAFERTAGFFNEECTDGSVKPDEPVHEKLVKYFNTHLKLIDSTYSLLDNNKKPLDKSKCISNYNFPYKIIFNLKDYLKANEINLN
jgi:hypothetical protein